jgi:uncharacterized protein YktA (UPF0223 family)
MIIYSVTIYVDKDVENDWVNWMKKIHIRDIMETDHFNSYRMFRILVPSNTSNQAEYNIQYECKSMDDYNTYQEKHAARLQKDHTLKFQNKVKVARSLMEEVND